MGHIWLEKSFLRHEKAFDRSVLLLRSYFSFDIKKRAYMIKKNVSLSGFGV